MSSASLGHDIRSAREEAELSLADVSGRTRIRASVIGEIESDNFAHCGGDVYARGHLRSIATAVGADVAPWIAAYDAEHGTVAPSASEIFESETTAPLRRRGANWSAVMGAALVVVVGLVVVQITSAADDPSRQTTTVAEPAPTPSPTTSGQAEPNDGQTQVAEADPQGVVVRMTALPNAISWVSVTRPDGSLVFEDNVSDGQIKTFRDQKKLNVVLGNASAIELSVNGQDIGSPGGTVVHLSFTPKDPDGTAG